MMDMSTLPVGYVYAFAWFNFLLCAGIFWEGVVRVRKMSAATTLARWRACYALMVAGAVCSGLSPIFWGEWPGPGQIAMGLSVLAAIMWGWRDWREGPPAYALKDGYVH